MARLRRALAQTVVVVEGGTTNRSFLLSLLGPAGGARRASSTTGGWTGSPPPAATCPRRTRSRCCRPRSRRTTPISGPREVAFHAAAARGRPEMPAEVGHRVPAALPRPGVPARRLPDRAATATGSTSTGSSPTCAVDRSSDYEPRLTVGGRTYRTVTAAQGATFRVDVDGRQPPGRPRRRRGGARRRAGLRACACRSRRGQGGRGRPGRRAGEHEDGDHACIAPVRGDGGRRRDRRQRPGGGRRAAAAHPGRTTPRTMRWTTCRLPGQPPALDFSAFAAAIPSGAVRAGVRGPAQLPARLRPAPGAARAGDGGPAPAHEGAARGRRRSGCGARTSCWTCSPTWPGCTGPAAGAGPARAGRAAAAGVPAVLPAVAGPRPGRPAGVLPAPPGDRARAATASPACERSPELEYAVVWMFRSFRRAADVCPAVTAILQRRLREPARGRRQRRPPSCAPGSTGWPPPPRAATRSSPTWPRDVRVPASSTSRSCSAGSPTTTCGWKATSPRWPPTRAGRTGRTWSSSWSGARSHCGRSCCAGGGRPPRCRRPVRTCTSCCWRCTCGGSTATASWGRCGSTGDRGTCSAPPSYGSATSTCTWSSATPRCPTWRCSPAMSPPMLAETDPAPPVVVDVVTWRRR